MLPVKYSEDVEYLKLLMKPYSGFNSLAYVDYVNNIDLFGSTLVHPGIASTYLENALEDIKNISFNADFHQDEIEKIYNQVNKDGRELILRTALKTGKQYINVT